MYFSEIKTETEILKNSMLAISKEISGFRSEISLEIATCNT